MPAVLVARRYEGVGLEAGLGARDAEVLQHPVVDQRDLRAFAFIAEKGSFTRAAPRIGRTRPALSMQVQRLEALLGQRVLQRGKGGVVQLTPHGHCLLERPRDMLALNDETWAAFHAPSVTWLAHGLRALPPDEALPTLPDGAILPLQAREPRDAVAQVLAEPIAASFGLGALA